MKFKKLIALLLTLVMLLAIPGAAALATDNSQSFEIALTSDKSGELKAGDEMSVTCTLRRTDKTESWQMYAWQTEIAFDNSVFELVEGSVSPASGVGSSVHPGVLVDKVYFNAYSFSASGEEYPAEFTAGTFTLRVKNSGGGNYEVKSTNYHVSTKGGADHYAIAAKDLTVSVKGDPALSAARFKDIPSGAWYSDAVSFVVSHGLFNGTGEDTFSPSSDMTRAMLVTVLWRLAGSPEVSAASKFTDVQPGAWYSGAVSWANERGIVTGYDEKTFGTNDSVTRQQMATILYRYAQSRGIAGTKTGDLAGFTDRGEVASWASDAMAWGNGTGLITGRTESNLVPNGTANRAEVATIFMRFCNNVLIGG